MYDPSNEVGNVQDFYQLLGSLVDHPLEIPKVFRDDPEADAETKTHAAIYERIQRFFGLLEDCFDRFLDQQYNLDYCTSRLLEAQFFRQHREEAATCILDLTARARSIQALIISYNIILVYGLTEPAIFRSIHHGVNGLAKDKIARLVHQIWAGHYAAIAEAALDRYKLDAQKFYAPSGRDKEAEETLGRNGADFYRCQRLQSAWGSASRNSIAAKIMSQRQANRPAPSSSYTSGSDAARMRLHQIRLREKAVRMLYEVCRVQRLDGTDMRAIDPNFVNHLFDLVEDTRHHEDEAFNYQLIKLIAALNEQFMVSSISQQSDSASTITTKNLVMGSLRSRLHVTKTFGENVIFMLNRASSHSAEDTCMQLLVLKLLYLLFTTEETAHYFYTNDLKVLVDVFIRELSDLPEESESLRHTYLRVLHPLLTNTQLYTYAYKRPQIRRLLKTMVSDSLFHGEVSATTKRLVQRCLDADWCVELDRLEGECKFQVAPEATEASTRAKLDKPKVADRRCDQISQLSDLESSAMGLQRADLAFEGAKPLAVVMAMQSSRLREAYISTGGDQSETRVSEQGRAADPHVQSLLNAPRLRSSSAQSAPTTPPPPIEIASVIPQAVSTIVCTGPDDEAAIALADGKAANDRPCSPSWQSQVVVPAPEGQTRSALLPVEALEVRLGHRPITRRASHNEFQRPNLRPSTRRAPPPAPLHSRRLDGLPRTPWISSMGAEGAGPVEPGPSTFQHLLRRKLDDISIAAGVSIADVPSLHVQTASRDSENSASIGSGGSSPSFDEERMTQSLGSITIDDHHALSARRSAASSPLRVDTPHSSTLAKQRRKPPAPPTAVAVNLDSSQSADSNSTLAISPPTSCDSHEGLTMSSQRRGSFAMADLENVRISRRQLLPVATGNTGLKLDALSSVDTPSSASGRRRPPPPPVDRSTKVIRSTSVASKVDSFSPAIELSR